MPRTQRIRPTELQIDHREISRPEILKAIEQRDIYVPLSSYLCRDGELAQKELGSLPEGLCGGSQGVGAGFGRLHHASDATPDHSRRAREE